MKESPETAGGWSKKWIRIFLCMTCTMLCYLGVLVMTISSVSRMKYEQLDVFMDIRMYRLVLFLTLVGTLSLVLAFIGFIGIWKENLPVLYTFCVLLVVFSMMESTVALIGCTQRNNIETEMDSNLWFSVNQYSIDVSLQPYVDQLQKQLKCCGVHNYTDWLEAMPPEDFTADDKDLIATLVPLSCCDLADNVQCTIYEDGCHSQLYDILYDTGKTVMTNTLAAVVLQLCAASFVLFLLQKLKLLKNFDDDGHQKNVQDSSFGYTKLQNVAGSTGTL